MSDISRSSTGNNFQGNTPGKSSPSVQSRVESVKDKVGDALDRGKSGIADSAYAAQDSLGQDMTKLREDMAAIQQTLSKFMSESGNEAYKTARNVGSAVASQVGGVASDVASQVGDVASDMANKAGEMANSAAAQAKTFASEMENMARRNPLGTIGAAVLVGVVIGMMSRSRA